MIYLYLKYHYFTFICNNFLIYFIDCFYFDHVDSEHWSSPIKLVKT